LIAEAPTEGNFTRRIEKGDIGAQYRLAGGRFDDFDAYVLSAGASAGCQDCRS
jgi:hypothetical protein